MEQASSVSAARRGSGLWLDAGAGALLLALTLFFYWEIGFAGRILTSYDLFTYTYPYKDFAAFSLRSGHIPLWNPYVFFGAPFLGNIQASTLYPVNVLTSYMASPQAISLSIILHIFIAGFGMYGFMRLSVRTGRAAALLSALVFMFGGFLTAQVGHHNQLTVSAWLPLLLMLFERAYHRGSLRIAAVAALVVFMQAMAGGPQQLYLSLTMLGLLAIVLVLRRALLPAAGWKGRLLNAVEGGGLLAGIVGLGVGMAAIQLLPAYELSGYSIRGGGLSYIEATSFSLPPPDMLKALLPGFTTNLFTEFVAYVGALALALALLGAIARWRHPYAIFAFILIVVGLIMALGKFTPVYEPAYSFVPGLQNFRVPARWLFLYTIGISVLAGLGMNALTDARLGGRLSRSLRPVIAVITFALVGLLVVWLTKERVTLPSTGIMMAWFGGGAIAIGVAGLSFLWPPARRWTPALLLLLVAVELFFARRELEAFKPVPADAYTSLRPAAAYLLVDNDGSRLLSIVDPAYDPGDKRELATMYGKGIGPERVSELIVAMKYREMLAPNLPIGYRLPSIDGYDGGVLPLRAYVQFKRLLLDSGGAAAAPPAAELPNQPDGILRNQLPSIPDARLLGALNVKHVLTDKRRDVWLENVYYDLGTPVVLGPQNDRLVLDELPVLASTSIGVISFLEGAAALPDGAPVARLTLVDRDGRRETVELRAGIDTSEGEYERADSKVAHAKARVASGWGERQPRKGDNYYARLELKSTILPERVEIQYLAEAGKLYLAGASLIDGRAEKLGGSVVSDSVTLDQRWRRVQSGDLKVYENLAYLPRSFAVHRATLAGTLEKTFAAMKGADLWREAVLEDTPAARLALSQMDWMVVGAEDAVEMLTDSPEKIQLRVRMASPGILILTDTNFPGWNVRVDGAPAEMLRANHLFRAVFLDAGEHTVEFRYSPVWYERGLVLSLVALGLLLGLVLFSFTPLWKRYAGRRR